MHLILKVLCFVNACEMFFFFFFNYACLVSLQGFVTSLNFLLFPFVLFPFFFLFFLLHYSSPLQIIALLMSIYHIFSTYFGHVIVIKSSCFSYLLCHFVTFCSYCHLFCGFCCHLFVL